MLRVMERVRGPGNHREERLDVEQPFARNKTLQTRSMAFWLSTLHMSLLPR